MKKTFKTGFLALSGMVAIAYFTLSEAPKQTKSTQLVKLDQTDNKTSSLTKVSSSKPSLILKTASPSKQTQWIWQSIAQQQRPKTLPDKLYVEYIKVVADNSLKFSEGEKISFLIPQEDKSYVGIINESTRAFGGDVKISSGDIDNGNEHASFSITEAEDTTFVTIATGKSIYQVEIDNYSGIGVVMDDRELNRYRYDGDGILPPPEGVS